jgi:hypothetical protein
MVRIASLIVILCLVCLSCAPVALAADSNDVVTTGCGVSVAVLGDADLNTLKGRIGYQISKTWEAGGVAVWYVEDEVGDTAGKEWGAGVYGKYIVDPDGTIPLAGWLPAVGSWLKLPASITAKTYLIGEAVAVPYDDDVDLAACLGAGAQVGIGVIEYTYGVVESGDSDDPVLTSGSTLWLALCIEF